MYKSLFFGFTVVGIDYNFWLKSIKNNKKYKIITFLFGSMINILYFYEVFKKIQNVKT